MGVHLRKVKGLASVMAVPEVPVVVAVASAVAVCLAAKASG